MTDIADSIRITSASTWTEVAGASATGKTAVPSTDRAYLDVLISNYATAANAVLVAVTSNNTAPTADTDAFDKATLAAEAEGSNGHRYGLERILLPQTYHLWVKSDQTDTRVMVNGYTEAAS